MNIKGFLGLRMHAAELIADHPEKVEKVIFTESGPILPSNRDQEDDAPDDKIEPGQGYYSEVKTAQSFQNTNDLRTKLKACLVPALIMRGKYDGIKWGYITNYLNLFTSRLLVVIPSAGHSIGREQLQLYLETSEN